MSLWRRLGVLLRREPEASLLAAQPFLSALVLQTIVRPRGGSISARSPAPRDHSAVDDVSRVCMNAHGHGQGRGVTAMAMVAALVMALVVPLAMVLETA